MRRRPQKRHPPSVIRCDTHPYTCLRWISPKFSNLRGQVCIPQMADSWRRWVYAALSTSPTRVIYQPIYKTDGHALVLHNQIDKNRVFIRDAESLEVRMASNSSGERKTNDKQRPHLPVDHQCHNLSGRDIKSAVGSKFKVKISQIFVSTVSLQLFGL